MAKKPSSLMASPKTRHINSSALGPCTAKGKISGSLTSTSKPKPTAKPLAHSNTSESATDKRQWRSLILMPTPSLIMLPFSSHMGK